VPAGMAGPGAAGAAAAEGCTEWAGAGAGQKGIGRRQRGKAARAAAGPAAAGAGEAVAAAAAAGVGAEEAEAAGPAAAGAAAGVGTEEAAAAVGAAAGVGAAEEEDVSVGYLDPQEFHAAAAAAAAAAVGSSSHGDTVILDVRNWYESRVGHFEGAVLAPIRRFGQLPEYIQQNPETFAGKKVLMYCTGGIRCEKAASYLAGLPAGRSGGRPASVLQLRGGIVAYARDVVEAGTQVVETD